MARVTAAKGPPEEVAMVARRAVARKPDAASKAREKPEAPTAQMSDFRRKAA
jgi:hypothetical protein